MTKISTIVFVAAASGLCMAPISVQWLHAKGPSVSLNRAEARIGRPLTPGSIAGVHRRVHRRAYYGAAVGAGVYNSAVSPYYHQQHCGYYPYRSCY